MSKTTPRKSEARKRLVETAERLFYSEGIHAVGIDRIIAEAEVAKMTLYNHFSSKDELILAVLEFREEKFDALFQKWMDRHISAGQDPLDAFFSALKDWFEGRKYRGCMFINSSVELADAKHAGARFSAEHKQRFHAMIKELIAQFAGQKAADSTAAAVSLLVEGAIVTSVMERSSTPAETARDATHSLISSFLRKRK